MGRTLDIPTPRWAVPLLAPARYKGAKGGRSSGKSHFFGELLVERMLEDRHLRGVCIREIQKSIKYSSKLLIESKIRSLGVSSSFRITGNEIRRINGTGICIFQGMQDHTADSIKSLEGFDVAWWEEAQRAKAKSLRLLRPTILRKKNAELWFSWNPDKDTDPVDVLFQNPPNSSVCVHVNYTENPFLEPHVLEEIEYDRIANPESFPHIWLGEHWAANKAQILNGKWVVEDFEAEDWFAGPYFGVDWGFSTDPLFIVKLWIGPHTKYGPNCLYVEYEASGIGIENQDIKHLFATVPGSKIHTLRADNARPELIRYVGYDGGFNAVAADKWPGSVEDGIDTLRSFNKIIIHSRCRKYADECKFYSYKVDKFTEEVLPVIIDKHNHGIDASRYALEPIIKKRLEGLTQKQIQAIENSNKTTEAPAQEERSW